MATTDDGFHEIQLSGKQLVFMFMAVTIVSVVIFLCGVLVGRGVRVAREAPAVPAATAETPAATDVPEAPPLEAPPAPAEPAGAPAGAAAPPPADGQDWSTLLSGAGDPEPLTEPASAEAKPEAKGAPVAAPIARETPAPVAPAPASAPTAPAASASDRRRAASAVPGEPTGPGFSVQVSALAEGNDAEALVRRLIGKGYPAYLVPQSAGQPQFRVRVGKYRDRREAERVAARLAKEEKFSPWVIR